MTDDANCGPASGKRDSAAAEADADALARHAGALVDALEVALPAWVERTVVQLVEAHRGSTDEAVRRQAAEAGQAAAADVGPRVRALLATDVDDQRSNPLALVREAARYPTAVLRHAGVPHVERDVVAERVFPDDVYDLMPASFAEIDPSLQEPGLIWGAAKAHVVLARRRAEGRR